MALSTAPVDPAPKPKPAPKKLRKGLTKAVARGRNTYSVSDWGTHSGLPPAGRPFTVLGIETSCDDTGVAVVRSDGMVLGEALASQHDIHEAYGGVVPNLARQAHEDQIDRMVDVALERAGLEAAHVDAVAATVGPGLELCLRVGGSKGRALARTFNKPFVRVHHLEAHTLLARPNLRVPGDNPPADASANLQVEFPFLALLVSGGHCQILLARGVGDYAVFGGTTDDALGEAYDKAARMLGLNAGAAGGPAMERLARLGDPHAVPLPVPMQKRRHDCDFSYAGLKNAFRLRVQEARENQGLAELDSSGEAACTDGAGTDLSDQTKADLAASFQRVAIQHLSDRIKRAIGWCNTLHPPPDQLEHAGGSDADTSATATAAATTNANTNTRTHVQDLAVVGGVAANLEVRRVLQEVCEAQDPPWRLHAPPPRLCTDNGVMVAWAAVEKLTLGFSDPVEPEDPRRDVQARWPIGMSITPPGP